MESLHQGVLLGQALATAHLGKPQQTCPYPSSAPSSWLSQTSLCCHQNCAGSSALHTRPCSGFLSEQHGFPWLASQCPLLWGPEIPVAFFKFYEVGKKEAFLPCTFSFLILANHLKEAPDREDRRCIWEPGWLDLCWGAFGQLFYFSELQFPHL